MSNTVDVHRKWIDCPRTGLEFRDTAIPSKVRKRRGLNTWRIVMCKIEINEIVFHWDLRACICPRGIFQIEGTSRVVWMPCVAVQTLGVDKNIEVFDIPKDVKFVLAN